ncbi:unnamed protein product, partial [Phaedon cochleariae]
FNVIVILIFQVSQYFVKYCIGKEINFQFIIFGSLVFGALEFLFTLFIVLYKFRFPFYLQFCIKDKHFIMTTEAVTEPPKIYYEEETQGERLARKSKEMPIFPIAIGLCLAAVGYGAYSFKNKGKMSTSVYLMQLRVGAQGAAVGALTLGLVYAMVNERFLKKKE